MNRNDVQKLVSCVDNNLDSHAQKTSSGLQKCNKCFGKARDVELDPNTITFYDPGLQDHPITLNLTSITTRSNGIRTAFLLPKQTRKV